MVVLCLALLQTFIEKTQELRYSKKTTSVLSKNLCLLGVLLTMSSAHYPRNEVVHWEETEDAVGIQN